MPTAEKMSQVLTVFSSLVTPNNVRAVALVLTAEEMKIQVSARSAKVKAEIVLEGIVEKVRVKRGLSKRGKVR